MGNNSNLSHWDIKFVQNLDDTNFGNIDIYKNEQGKYIMMLRRTFMKDQKNKYKDYGFHQMLQYITTQPQSQQFFTPIMHSNVKIQNICVVYQVIDNYCQYFNFTLADMIKHKKQMDKEQLWFCFHWFLKYAILIKQKQWIMPEGFKLNKVFLTLKGLPTVSIHHLIKTAYNDQVIQKQKSLIQEIGLMMLQLTCMTTLTQNDNLELFLRKAQKIDINLGQILNKILKQQLKVNRKIDQQSQILKTIEKLLQQQLISQTKQIKINKFKYIIPKPQVKQQIQSLQKSKISEYNQKKEKQAKSSINSLHGRKNKQNLSLKNSNKRDNNLDCFENRLLTLQTPMNKVLSIKSTLLMDQIQYRKRQTQKQKQKLTERKEMIMKSGVKSVNKENMLGNSIRQIRSSYNGKQSWAKKVIADHLKQSFRS